MKNGNKRGIAMSTWLHHKRTFINYINGNAEISLINLI